jgi:GNAT superfamily N-acetyltransferase
MKLVLVDHANYKEAIKIQNRIFPDEDGTINILASLDRDTLINKTGIDYDEDHVKYYIAYDNGEAIGITGLYYLDDESAWLAWFGVLPDKRRRSYGRRILEETMRIVKQRGFKTMRLYTDIVDNADAARLYEKLGFVGEKYSAEKLPYDCWIYSKSLYDEMVVPWGDKNLGLSHQTQLDHLSKQEVEKILKLYEQ